jgi:beta-agarase
LYCTIINFYPVPASAGTGKQWQIQPQSDEFNYNFSATEAAATFGSKWTNFYHNQWDGPGPTKWRRENTSVAAGQLQIKATRIPGETKTYDVDLNLDGINDQYTSPATRAGCITSTTRVQYPVFVEARVKIANAVMASDVWLLSPDDTEEIDILEAYGGKASRNDWFNQRLHLSHHLFIRNPFTDYQPRDASTWYTGQGATYWADHWLRIGVNWVSPTRLEYYVNGELVKVLDKLKTENGIDGIDPWNFTGGKGITKEMDIIINMEDQNWNAAQGRQPTDAEITNADNHTFKVDWIRVYKPVVATVSSSSSSIANSSSSSSSSAASGTTQKIDFANYFDTGKSTSAVAGDNFIGFNKSGGGNINYNTAGDWGDYLVTLPTDGQYKFEIVTASPMTSGIGAKLSIDGIYVATATLGATGGWEIYSTTTLANSVSIGAGTHTLRIESAGTSAWQWNGDEIRVTKVGSDPIGSPVTPTPVAMTLQAESFSATGGVYDGFKTYTVNGVGGINYNQRGDWVDYSVNVAVAGNYTFNAYVSSPMTGAALNVSVDGVKVLTQAVPNNGAWDAFQKVSSSSKIALTKGTHTIRVTSAGTTASTGEWNADKFELIP